MAACENEDVVLLHLWRRQRERENRVWLHELTWKREELGEYNTLVRELSSHEDKFFNYFRMSEEQFNHVFSLVEDDLQKQVTHFRKPVSARQRLAICIRFLATGDSYKTFHYSYRIGNSTIVGIIPDTCEAIWKRLQPIYMAAPDRQEWESIAEGFMSRWQFPNCIGAIDGKHVVIQAPPNSGSMFYNYKHTFSIVLMALVDYMYCFRIVDVGAFGSNSDGGILSRSSLAKHLESDELNIPPSRELPGATEMGKLPYVSVGDEAFPLKRYLMRPYPGRNLDEGKRIYNYRLSRAKRVVENAFGILAARWRIYQRRIQLQPQNVDKVVKATCVLHNLLQKSSTAQGVPANEHDSVRHADPPSWQTMPMRGCHAGQDALNVREQYQHYFMSDAGAVPWQGTSCFGH